MRASWIFNQQQGRPLERVFGCVTNGDNWRFMQLTDTRLAVDTKTYFIVELPTVLGVLQHIINVA